MAEVSGTARAIGRLGSLSVTVGVISFLLGLFVLPRIFAIVGVGLMILSVALYWIEETGHRRLQRTSWR